MHCCVELPYPFHLVVKQLLRQLEQSAPGNLRHHEPERENNPRTARVEANLIEPVIRGRSMPVLISQKDQVTRLMLRGFGIRLVIASLASTWRRGLRRSGRLRRFRRL